MSNKIIQLSIPKPCSEKWNEMTPTEKGRFCSVCERNLIDFTHFSDDELLRFVKKNDDKICGRFTKNQLDRKIESTVVLENKIIQYSKVAGFVLPSLIANEAFSQVSYFEKETPLPASREHTYYDDSIKSVEKNNQQRFEFKFLILDSVTNEPIPEVYLKYNSDLKAVSDFDGKISIELMDSSATFKFIDHNNEYFSKEITINSLIKIDEPISVQMKFDQANNIGMIGYVIQKPKWWQIRRRINYWRMRRH
jgi:hypothetical protein